MAIINVPESTAPGFTPEFRVIDHGEQVGSYSTISYIINGIEYVEEDLTKQMEFPQLTFVTTFQFETDTIQVYCNGVLKSEVYDYQETGAMSFVFIERTASMQKWFKPDGIVRVKYVKKRS